MKKPGRKPQSRRVNKKYFVSRSGKSVKLNRSIADRFRSNKDGRAKRRAASLSTLPKGKIKRFFARF